MQVVVLRIHADGSIGHSLDVTTLTTLTAYQMPPKTSHIPTNDNITDTYKLECRLRLLGFADQSTSTCQLLSKEDLG